MHWRISLFLHGQCVYDRGKKKKDKISLKNLLILNYLLCLLSWSPQEEDAVQSALQ